MGKIGKPAGLARKVNRYLRVQAKIKEQYAILDEVFDEILPHMKPGDVVGKGILVDNFADRQKVFRAHGISRYELKLVGA